MDAVEFFKLWKRKFERLMWIPFYSPKGRAGTAEWYMIAQTPDEEANILNSDDDSSEDDEEYSIEDDGEVSDDEVNGLVDDADIEEARLSAWKNEPQSLDPTTNDQAVGFSQHEQVKLPYINLSSLDRKTREVYRIWTNAGWPSNFDREGCRAKLAEFLERQEDTSHQPAYPLSEQEAIAMRQRMIEKHQEKLQYKTRVQDRKT
ncbi:MAG: hypothetical protein L6R41_005696 [Letrouitia leprolyta]|nr:MAG: hypothetical protein L6R41_005696 [Letrouitia leprolyta]